MEIEAPQNPAPDGEENHSIRSDHSHEPAPLVSKLGDLKDDERDWDLFRLIKGGQFNENSHENLGAAATGCQEFLAELSQIRCVACGGFGHNIKRCPTNKKIVARAKYCRYEPTIFNQAKKSLDFSFGANQALGKWAPLN